MPYQPHPAFSEPNDNKIWRYLDFPQFIKLLETHSLWFTRTDQFEDPYEGVFPVSTMAILIEQKESRQEDLREIAEEGVAPQELVDLVEEMDPEEDVFRDLELFRRISFLNCWHMNDYESMGMWKANLASNEGVVIQSTFKRLKEALDPDNGWEYHLGQIRYIDFFNDDIREELDNMFRSFVYKQQEYEYEQEIRAVIKKMPDTEQDDLSPGDTPRFLWDEHPAGFPVRVDLDTLIQTIRISPIAPSWHDEDFFEKILSTYEIDKPVESSVLDVQPREMVSRRDRS